MGFQVYPTPSTESANTFTFLADDNAPGNPDVSTPGGTITWYRQANLPAGLYQTSPTPSATAGTVLIGGVSITPSSTSAANGILATASTTAGIQKRSSWDRNGLFGAFSVSTDVQIADWKVFDSGVFLVGTRTSSSQSVYSTPLAVSTDGTSWERTYLGFATNSGKYAAHVFAKLPDYYAWMSGGPLMTSTDLVNWTTKAVVSPPSNPGKVFYDTTLNMFIAAGASWSGPGSIRTSTDAINWTTRLLYSTVNVVNYAERLNNFIFVSGSASSDAPFIQISTDAINWATVTMSTDQIYWSTNKIPSIQAMAYHNNRYIAGATYGQRMWSTDGVNWNITNTLGNRTAYAAAFTDGTYVALLGAASTSEGAMFSTNGTSWADGPAALTTSMFGPTSANRGATSWAAYMPNFSTRKYWAVSAWDSRILTNSYYNANTTLTNYSNYVGGSSYAGTFEVIVNRYNITVDIR